MPAIEILVFILAVIALCVRGLWIELSSNWNDNRRDAALTTLLEPIKGQPIGGAIERFGQPAEVVPGTTGRALYIWRAPPAKRFPSGKGLLIVTLTADEAGTITDAQWVARAT